MDDWSEDTGINLEAAFLGITTPLKDIVDEIHKRGWVLKSVKFKKDQWEAVAQNPADKGQVVSRGPTEQTAAGNVLLKVIRTELIRSGKVRQKLGMWKSGWEDQLGPIAQAYAEASVYDPKAAPAWQELAEDSVRRARILHQQLKVEVTDNPVPYKTVQDLIEDVTKKKHILLSRSHTNHPVWSIDQVLAFRLVHDVLGHVVAGSDWGWHGENVATQAHMPLLGTEAQKALFTEAIGQTAYGAVYRAFGPQKIAILKDFIEPSQQSENSPGHAPVHPTQALTPAAIPQIEPVGPKPAHRAHYANVGHRDPNHDWRSGVAPLPDNGFLWQRDPETDKDPLDTEGLMESLGKHDTAWHSLAHPDGTDDYDSQRQAVVNSLRAVILAPRKADKWAAIHYQHVKDLPASVSDPKRFHDALEQHRENWNQARGHAPQSHAAPYWGELQKFKQYIKALHPTANDRELHDMGDRTFRHMWNEEEERIVNDDADGLFPANEVGKLVGESLAKRLKVITRPNIDAKTDFGDRTLFHDSHQPDPEMYGHWLGNSVNTLANVGQHADRLTQAALEDIRQHGGRGHHFRTQALGLGIQGLPPRAISLAWSQLNPYTSQIAPIDPHLLEILGHTPDEMSDRDYFKFERELAAGRDAAGYGHIPLGAFAHGLWNLKNYGEQTHPDTSHFRALNPTPYEQIDWMGRPERIDQWGNPYWWESTQAARQDAGTAFDRTIAPRVPRDAYPFQAELPELPRLAAVQGKIPWFTADDGSIFEGSPGQTLMQHLRNTTGLSTEEVWALDPEVGKR